MSPKRTTQDGRLSQPSEVPAMPCWRTQSRRQRLSVRLFQKRATASMSTVQRLLLRPRTPRTRGTNVKQTSKTRPSSPTTQPDSTRSAVDRTVNRWPLQREAAANDARTAPTPPVTTRWNTAGHPQGTPPDIQTSTSPRGGPAIGWRRQCQWGAVVELHVSFTCLQV